MSDRRPSSAGIVVASPADAPVIARMAVQTFRETYAALIPPEILEPYIAERFQADALHGELSDPLNTFLVASAEDGPAGFAKLSRSRAPRCVEGPDAIELSRLYVTKTWWGTGLGSRLLDSTSEIARASHASRTQWLAVWEHNPRAIAFYRRSGFIEAGTMPFRMGAALFNDLVMVRNL